MARLHLVFLTLCVLPALLSAGQVPAGKYIVRGRVFCDPCLAGFETSATTYIQGARVRVECKDRDNLKVVYGKEALTDATGTYKVLVEKDHEDQICDCVLVKSPMKTCFRPGPGRDSARVILTDNNGLTSRTRHANNMGFVRHEPLPGCTQLLKQYLNYDEAE